MTARRQARTKSGGRWAVAGMDVPPELADLGDPVWHDTALYRAFMAEHRWTLPPQERMGCQSSPGHRRMHAAGDWAVGNGVTSDGAHPDWHRLRALGLIN